MPTILMSLIWVSLFGAIFGCLHDDFLPGNVDAVLAGELIEDAIATNHYEIVVILDLEGSHIRVCNHDARVALVLGQLGLNVSDSLGDRESAREDTMGSVDHLLSSLAEAWVGLDDLRVLVDASTVLDDPLHLALLRGLVVG